ncbi:MAG: peptide-methionine (R)-S-oxide reductase MsrB [Pseudomonadales bacterium]|nr:peptide-methionine (R)-S-oxide reductase MsrB [Pseudomonadales bacterium]
MSKFKKTEQEWRDQLSGEQYRVTREAATEVPFTGEYCDSKGKGVYQCVCCGKALFESNSKFDSGCGWPSFDACLGTSDEIVTEAPDLSLGRARTEIICTNCDAHLGHVFEDGPTDTGLRYCVNSASLNFESDE